MIEIISKIKKGEVDLSLDLIEFFRETFETHLDLGVAILLENGFHYVNKKLSEILGYLLEDIKDWNIERIISCVYETDRDKVFTQFKEKLINSKSAISQYKFRVLHKSGEPICVNLFTKRIIIDGQPSIFITINPINATNCKLPFERNFDHKELFGKDFAQLNQIYKILNKDLLEDLRKVVINFVKDSLNEINQI